jgi:hypothetical protein
MLFSPLFLKINAVEKRTSSEENIQHKREEVAGG